MATESFMHAARSFQAVATVVLICVGGIFAYQRLQIFRTFEPHLTITHKVSHRHISDSHTHIAVTATLRNSSKVQVELRGGLFRLQKIAPLFDETIKTLHAQVFIDKEQENIQWPTLDEVPRTWKKNVLIVEPGESHPETYEFIMPRGVADSVLIYTYLYDCDSRFSQDAPSPRGGVIGSLEAKWGQISTSVRQFIATSSLYRWMSNRIKTKLPPEITNKCPETSKCDRPAPRGWIATEVYDIVVSHDQNSNSD